MSSGPLGVPGAKASLLLSTLLSVMGIGGVLGSYGVLSYVPGSASAGVMADAAAQAFTELMVSSTLMSALAAANILVSALLVVSSFAVMMRRRSSLWWIGQALVGNVLYTLAAVVGAIVFHHAHADALQSIAEQLPPLAEAPPDTPIPSAWAILAIRDACMGFVALAVYGVIWRLSRRADVRAFLGVEPAD